MTIPEGVYLLCALASTLCAAMLFRGYLQKRTPLLLYSSLCFLGLVLNNILLFVDLGMYPGVDFSGTFWRNLIGAALGSILLYGLIWELT